MRAYSINSSWGSVLVEPNSRLIIADILLKYDSANSNALLPARSSEAAKSSSRGEPISLILLPLSPEGWSTHPARSCAQANVLVFQDVPVALSPAVPSLGTQSTVRGCLHLSVHRSFRH